MHPIYKFTIIFGILYFFVEIFYLVNVKLYEREKFRKNTKRQIRELKRNKSIEKIKILDYYNGKILRNKK